MKKININSNMPIEFYKHFDEAMCYMEQYIDKVGNNDKEKNQKIWMSISKALPSICSKHDSLMWQMLTLLIIDYLEEKDKADKS